MIQSVSARLEANRQIAPRGWIMTLSIPGEFSPRAGQFTHLRVHPGSFVPFLRRPFSIWDWRSNGQGTLLDILYTVRGVGTSAMAHLQPGAEVGFVGPLGNWFEVPEGTKRVLLVAGGAGIVPFNFFARQMPGGGPDTALLFGARVAAELYGLEDLQRLSMRIETCTEDGSHGLKGRVTDLLRRDLEAHGREGVRVYGCGPWGMLAAVAGLAKEEGVGCTLSLETHMGCALGACRACVVPVRRDEDWRFSRVCCEGPNYDARELIFE